MTDHPFIEIDIHDDDDDDRAIHKLKDAVHHLSREIHRLVQQVADLEVRVARLEGEVEPGPAVSGSITLGSPR